KGGRCPPLVGGVRRGRRVSPGLRPRAGPFVARRGRGRGGRGSGPGPLVGAAGPGQETAAPYTNKRIIPKARRYGRDRGYHAVPGRAAHRAGVPGFPVQPAPGTAADV